MTTREDLRGLPVRTAVALGSNLPSRFGGPAANVVEALRRMVKLGRVCASSTLYETEPVGLLEQPRFVNAAAVLETVLGPLELLRAMLAIEQDMGRDRAAVPSKGPRVIDLDLLLYNGPSWPLTLHDPALTLPHPAMRERGFVLEPLAEIAPEWTDPRTGRTVAQLLEDFRSRKTPG